MFKGIPIKSGMRCTLFEEFSTTTHVRIRFQEDYATAKTSFQILRSLYRPKEAESSKHTSKPASKSWQLPTDQTSGESLGQM